MAQFDLKAQAIVPMQRTFLAILQAHRPSTVDQGVAHVHYNRAGDKLAAHCLDFFEHEPPRLGLNGCHAGLFRAANLQLHAVVPFSRIGGKGWAGLEQVVNETAANGLYWALRLDVDAD